MLKGRVCVEISKYTVVTLRKLTAGAGEMDGSDIKSVYCSCRGPGLSFQHPHNCSQLQSQESDDLFWLLQACDAWKPMQARTYTWKKE